MEEKLKNEKNKGKISKETKTTEKKAVTKEKNAKLNDGDLAGKDNKSKKGKKSNIGKIIFIIFAILITLFIIHTFRNYYIVLGLQNKILEYSESDNYHLKNYNYANSGTEVIMDYYKKQEKQVVVLQTTKDGSQMKRVMYDNGERVDVFTKTENSKIAELNTGTMMYVGIYNRLETDNAIQTLFTCIGTKIKSAKYNGKDCYALKNVITGFSLISEDEVIYIEKDTGLLVAVKGANGTIEREYEFNNVSDSVFVEPNIGEYTIK